MAAKCSYNRLDVTRDVAKRLSETNKQVSLSLTASVIEAFFESVTSLLGNYGSGTVKVSLTGDIIFVAKDVPASKGRNPKDGKEISIPAKRKVSVKVGKSFKEVVNKSK